MTSMNLYRAFGGLDPDLLEKTTPEAEGKRPRKNGIVKWTSLAACLLMMLVAVIMLRPFDNRQFEIPQTVKFNRADYVICGSRGEAAILKDTNLPEVITRAHAGALIAYLDVDGNIFRVAEETTDVLMFEYAPSPCENVYIVLIDGEYFAAIRHDENGYHGIPE